MNTIRRIAVAVAAVALGTGLANAQSTTGYTYTIPDGSYILPQTIPVQTFDPLYGTLTGITLTFEGDFLLGLTVYNYDDLGTGPSDPVNNGSYSSSVTGESTITGPAALYMDLMATTSTVSNANLAPLGTDTWSALPASNTLTANPADLSDYIGGPAKFTDVYFNVVGLVANYDDISGDLSFGPTGLEGATLDVTYAYTPASTPEPATMLMVGTGLLGLGLIRKRVQK